MKPLGERRMHWNVGRVKITKIVELETVGSTRFILPLASNEEIQKLPWLIPHFATEEGRLKMSIHSLVIETPSRRIVVDTGLGNDKQGRKVPTWNNRKDPFLDTLTSAGFAPDSIDTVLCTHLHVDHVGWNTKLVGGKWLPTFANARYLFGRTEYEHWRDHSEESDKIAVFNDSVRPIADAGKADLVASDAKICDEIALISTPGHSPGHMSLHIKSDGEEGLLTGCRPPPLPDGPSGLVVDRRFRPGSISGDTARIIRAFCRYPDLGDRRAFQRRPYQTRWKCL
jgi:glyoxylase-like metal-dependent hydrolase (beta-lactamase superfamily II)